MIPTRSFHPIAGSSVTATDIAAHPIGGDTSLMRRIRFAWTGGPGYVAFGGSGVVGTDATNKVYLPVAAGVEMIEVDSKQTHWAVTTGITANVVLSS